MRLLKLEPSARRKGRWLCHLEDGTILRVGEGEVVAFALHSGMELEEGTRAQLEAAARTSKAKDRALNLLAVRPLSRSELVKKLIAKETEPAEAEAVADRLEELGLLNDEHYAQTLVGHYAEKGYGVYKIKEELYRRGVPRPLWEGALAALEELEDTGALDALLRQKLRGAEPDDRKALKRATDALARRGYRWAEIGAALRRYGAEAPEEYP